MAQQPLAKIRILSIQIESLDADVRQLREELSMLQHLDDDAQRDAAVSDGWEDRTEARRTAADVARIDNHLLRMERSRSKLVAKRDRLIRKLAAG